MSKYGPTGVLSQSNSRFIILNAVRLGILKAHFILWGRKIAVELLGNTTFQFIVSISLNLTLGIIMIWLAVRRTYKSPLAYETISQVAVSADDAKVKPIIANFDFSPWGFIKPKFQLLTFKLWNRGAEPVILDDEDKPLIVKSNGVQILDRTQVISNPDDLKYKCDVVDGTLHFVIPRLDPNDALTVQILMPIYLYKPIPEIRVSGHSPQPMLIANTIRLSREYFILGMFFLFSTIFLFFSIKPPYTLQLIGILGVYFAGGLLFLIISWAARIWSPSPELLPSTIGFAYLMAFIKALPFFIPIGIVAFLIYHWFGGSVLFGLFFYFLMIFMPICAWYALHIAITDWLKKKKKQYNVLLVGFLIGIPFLAYYVMCVFAVIDVFKY